MKWTSIILLSVCFCCLNLRAQESGKLYPEEKVVSFESKSYDFGDILLSDGAVSCAFKFTNKADFPIQIFNIVSSCGCTKPTWTNGFIQPGESGRIDVVFNNNQGPYPFDKTLTVYVSNLAKPVLLHVRGVSHEKMKPLDERFPLHAGRIGLRNMESTLGNIEQGRSKSDFVRIANFGRRNASVRVIPLTAGLSANVVPDPVPANSTAELRFCVDTRRTDGQKWGREQFLCRFEVDGKLYPDTFRVSAFIRDDFSAMDEAALARAACAAADVSYFEFGEVAAGKPVTAVFTIKNTGRSVMNVRKIDCDDAGVQVLTAFPFTVKPGASATVRARVNTRRDAGEVLAILSILTDSPSKPILNLFITGNIKK